MIATKTIAEAQQEVVQAINDLGTLERKYDFLLSKAREVNAMLDSAKNQVGTVKGCSNSVWIDVVQYPFIDAQNRVVIQFDSDSLLIKGLIWVYAKIFDKQPALDVSLFDANVLEQIGLGQHITATRANGLKKVLEYIKQNAKNLCVNEKDNQR